jgi:hypothetical protein
MAAFGSRKCQYKGAGSIPQIIADLRLGNAKVSG